MDEVITSYVSDRDGQLLKIKVNRNIVRMDYFNIVGFDEKGQLDPYWFLSIVNNLGDMKRYHVPTIIDTVDEMAKKMKELNSGEEGGTSGC